MGVRKEEIERDRFRIHYVKAVNSTLISFVASAWRKPAGKLGVART